METSPEKFQPISSHSSSTILDNSQSFCMAMYLKSVLSDTQCMELKVATGYWDLPGMQVIETELQSFLDRGGKMQLLLGEEPMVHAYQMEEQQLPDSRFPDFYIERDIQRLNAQYASVAKLLLKYLSKNEGEKQPQIQVRVYRKEGEMKFLHAKCYIFLGQNFAKGIIGSSNFTRKGLLENAELNYVETTANVVTATPNEYTNTKSHLTWFEEKWAESIPWTGQFKQILEKAPWSSPLTPYEVYIRMLQEYFQIDDGMDNTISQYLSAAGYQQLDYQVDAIKRCYQLMRNMHGFLLADVVGLGKTIIGAIVLRYFLEHEHTTKATHPLALIVTPPSIKSNWEDTMDTLDKNQTFKMRDFVDVVSLGALATTFDDEESDENKNLDIEKKEYGLILIDESHRFRNGRGRQMYDSLMDAIENMEIRPFVGLISATPQNNRPKELWNQIAFFVESPRQSQFGKVPGGNIEQYFQTKNREYENYAAESNTQGIITVANDIRDNVLSDIIVRRTRNDILNYYPQCAIDFPRTIGPNVLEYSMLPPLDQLFNDSVNAITEELGYHRYSAIAELRNPEDRQRYENRNMTVSQTTQQLATMMRIMLVKRLESSFTAFLSSLKSLRKKTQNMLDMWNADRIYICPALKVNEEIDNAPSLDIAFQRLDEEIRQLPHYKNEKEQNRAYSIQDFDAEYPQKLQADISILDHLIQRWETNQDDPKLDTFLQNLPLLMGSDLQKMTVALQELKQYPTTDQTAIDKLLNDWDNLLPLLSRNENEHKLVIFTEAIHTLDRLKTVCEQNGYAGRVLTVTSANRHQMEPIVRSNFDANIPKEQQENDYDIIICTEVLSEGINLHRANTILNYDSPWNATKLIQRIGRVNRIGSQSSAIFVYNFFPSTQGDKLIGLVGNAYAKLQAFHILFGEDGKIFDPHEVLSPVSFMNTINGTLSPEMVFWKELNDYKASQPQRFEYIMQQPTPLQIALQATPKETICMLRQNNASNASYVCVANGNAYLLSPLQMMEKCKCLPSDGATPLPTTINADEQRAETCLLNTINARQKRMNNRNVKAKKQTEAQRILATIWGPDVRFQGITNLAAIRQAVDSNVQQTINSVISINQQIESTMTAQQVQNLVLQKLRLPQQTAQTVIGQTITKYITFVKQ